MGKYILLFVLIISNNLLNAQGADFDLFISYFDTELILPVESTHKLNRKDTINNFLVNKYLFENQNERAKFYNIKGKLIRVTTYGRIPEDPMIWNTWADETQTGRVQKKFYTKSYPIGRINHYNNYHILINKVIGFEYTYYDLYVFNKDGKLLSLVNLYEAEYKVPGFPEKGLKVYLTSSITKEGIIKWHQERFGVTTDREYKLREDGIFEVISQKIEGEFDY